MTNDNTKEVVNDSPTQEQITEFNRQIRDAARHLKKRLRHLSKGDIIKVCIDQALREQDMRNIAKQLFEENKNLKEQLNASKNKK